MRKGTTPLAFRVSISSECLAFSQSPFCPLRLEFFARTRLNPTMGETSFVGGDIRGGGIRNEGFEFEVAVEVDTVAELSVDVDEVSTESFKMC